MLAAAITVLALLVGGVFATTWLLTTKQFHEDAGAHTKAKKDDERTVAPLLPYAIPGLGHTIVFADQVPGSFFRHLQSQCQRFGLTSVSILLAGVRTHLVWTPDAVSAEFKARQLTRHRLDQQLGVNLLAMSKAEAEKTFPASLEKTDLTTERIHSSLLLNQKAVHMLTAKFVESFEATLPNGSLEVNLYSWLRERLFEGSTEALCGSELLRMFPDIINDYQIFEDNLLNLMFGTPKIFARDAYNARDRLLDRLERWLKTGYQNRAPQDDMEWEPYFGAAVIRKRHEYYAQQKMSLRAQAGADLIFWTGIISNAVPTTGWLLLHILSPTTEADILPRIVLELESVRRPDGTIDIDGLCQLPLLNSMFHETLRLYADVLVVRQVDAPTALGNISVQKGEQVMGSTWMAHRNEQVFERPEDFVPQRFVVRDQATGQDVCSTAGLAGKFFPFGGGHYMCPGRTFARQEVLVSVAILLLNFDVVFNGFVDGKGNTSANFPKLKRTYPGNQVMGIDGDMRVRITRKTA